MRLLKNIMPSLLISFASLSGFSSSINDLIHMGNGFMSRGDLPQAIFYYTQAIQEEPSSVRAYLCRAEAYLLIDKYHNAMDDYRKAIQIDPDFVERLIYQKKAGRTRDMTYPFTPISDPLFF